MSLRASSPRRERAAPFGGARTRAARIEQAKAREEAAFTPAAWRTLLGVTVLLALLGAVALWNGFKEPLLRADDVVVRMVLPERIMAAPDALVLHEGVRAFRIGRALWRGRDGDALAAALPAGQAVMVWVPAADTARAVLRVVGIETAALRVPLAVGLREATSNERAYRWGGLVVLGVVVYAGYLLATRRAGRAGLKAL